MLPPSETQRPRRCGSLANGGFPHAALKALIISVSTSRGTLSRVSFQATTSSAESASCQISRPPQWPIGSPSPTAGELAQSPAQVVCFADVDNLGPGDPIPAQRLL